MKKSNYWLLLCITIGIVIGLFIGNILPINRLVIRYIPSDENKLTEIFDRINRTYVDTVNIGRLVERAIPSILSGLDPHSSYISAEDMVKSGDLLKGHFSGIGVEFIIYRDTVAIVKIIPGGPSDALGLKPFDRIVMVNDTLFAGTQITNDNVLDKLRGLNNTKVKLGLYRPAIKDTLSVIITRDDVPVNSINVAYEADKGIGYIKIFQFASTTYNEFISAIAKLKSQGCTSFIIDLQQNGGGMLATAQLMANEFLNKDDLIFFTEGRVYRREESRADGNGICKEDNVIILMDEASASASEVFAGAIQDNDRGLILGRRSFGKGLVQHAFRFQDGSEMRLTIARYHTPSGRCVQKEYKIGENDSYNQDLINRYLRGEFDSRDSIKIDNLPLFQTTSGRPVYGNDGIMPDIFIPRDTIGINSYYIKILRKGLLREFSFAYCEQNKDIFDKIDSWEEAFKYLQAQSLVDKLADYAYSKGVIRRPQLIAESRNLLKTQLEAFILSNLYGEEVLYRIYQHNDVLIDKAIKLIKEGKATPQSIKDRTYQK